MLFQSTSSMDSNNQRQHRRQQSTPTTIEVSNMSNFPATHRQQPGSQHRRGTSLSQPVSQLRQPFPQETQYMVGITNTGHTSQHILQEAQQQRQALPGLQENETLQDYKERKIRELEIHIDSIARQSHGAYQLGTFSEEQAQKMQRSRSNPHEGRNLRTILEGGDSESSNNLLPPFTPFDAGFKQDRRRPSTSGGSNAPFGGPKPEQSNWQQQMQGHVRQKRRGNAYPTSATAKVGPHATTSYADSVDVQTMSDAMDTSATIKPVRTLNQPSHLQAAHIFFQAESTQDNMDPNATIRGQARPVILRTFSQTDLFDPLSTDHASAALKADQAQESQAGAVGVAVLPQGVAPFVLVPAGQDSINPQTPIHSPIISSTYSTPHHHRHDSHQQPSRHGGDCSSMSMNEVNDYPQSTPSHSARTSIDFGREVTPISQNCSSDVQLAGLDLDGTVEETGITVEDIQKYISDADNDGKWACLWPGCDANRFGRKENVRAHVQTHLGDRRYRCAHCDARFVRQHDLKRHATTHSGSKPHPCKCGASFARHDALTRHRQRNVCSGGLGGFVKKAAKRGRPRKARPDDEERVNKAARTRQRVTNRSYASSVSGTSMSGTSDGSQAHSPMSNPYSDMEEALMKDQECRAFTSLEDYAVQRAMMSYTPPMSPHSTGTANFPKKAYSNTAGHSPEASCDDAYHGSGSSFEDDQASRTPAASSHFDSLPSSPPGLTDSSNTAPTNFPDFSGGLSLFNTSLSEDSASRVGLTLPRASVDDIFPVDSYASSPEDLNMFDDAFDDDSWKDGDYYNFDGNDGNNGFFQAKDSTCFNDEMLFSDNLDDRYV